MDMKGNESNEQPSGILIRSRVPQTLLTLLTLWGGVINPLLALLDSIGQILVLQIQYKPRTNHQPTRLLSLAYVLLTQARYEKIKRTSGRSFEYAPGKSQLPNSLGLIHPNQQLCGPTSWRIFHQQVVLRAALNEIAACGFIHCWHLSTNLWTNMLILVI